MKPVEEGGAPVAVHADAPQVQGFFHPPSGTVSYVAHDGPGSACVIVDPVLDYMPNAGRTETHSADALIDFVRTNALQVQWILETHAHADHLTAAPWMKAALGGKIGIGERITQVQQSFAALLGLEPLFLPDGSQFDALLCDGQVLACGRWPITVVHVPGHTPADVAYRMGDAVFLGDTLFMPDVGTARADFPGGDAHALYQSISKLLTLPAHTRLFTGHDYPCNGRGAAWLSTVAEQRMHNIHVHDGVDEKQYVATRQARDRTLAVPQLLLPAIQVNIRAGAMPPKEANGLAYLKIPLNAF